MADDEDVCSGHRVEVSGFEPPTCPLRTSIASAPHSSPCGRPAIATGCAHQPRLLPCHCADDWSSDRCDYWTPDRKTLAGGGADGMDTDRGCSRGRGHPFRIAFRRPWALVACSFDDRARTQHGSRVDNVTSFAPSANAALVNLKQIADRDASPAQRADGGQVAPPKTSVPGALPQSGTPALAQSRAMVGRARSAATTRFHARRGLTMVYFASRECDPSWSSATPRVADWAVPAVRRP